MHSLVLLCAEFKIPIKTSVHLCYSNRGSTLFLQEFIYALVQYIDSPFLIGLERNNKSTKNTTSEGNAMEKTGRNLEIDDRVVWLSDHGPELGTVRWLGYIDGRRGPVAGVEFVSQTVDSPGHGRIVGHYFRIWCPSVRP